MSKVIVGIKMSENFSYSGVEIKDENDNIIIFNTSNPENDYFEMLNFISNRFLGQDVLILYNSSLDEFIQNNDDYELQFDYNLEVEVIKRKEVHDGKRKMV